MKKAITLILVLASVAANALEEGRYKKHQAYEDGLDTIIEVLTNNVIKFEETYEISEVVPQAPYPSFCRIYTWGSIAEEKDGFVRVQVKNHTLGTKAGVTNSDSCQAALDILNNQKTDMLFPVQMLEKIDQ